MELNKEKKTKASSGKLAGKLIVIEGTDGSGKATQAKLLYDRLTKEGYECKVLDFPQYGEFSAAMVEAYLNGKFGSSKDVGPYRASIFYAIDRYAKSHDMQRWLKEGKVLICNRYVTANVGHQGGKFQESKSLKEFIDWLYDLEYHIFGMPKPDMVIFLHMPPEIGQKLVEKKGHRDYVGGEKKDLHEADISHLKDAERAYIFAAKNEGWNIIKCSEKEEPLPIDSINAKIFELVSRLL